MKGMLITYEVEVRKNGKVDMFHYNALNPGHAGELAKKHGQVMAVRKADYFKMKGDSGKLDLSKTKVGSLYETAIGRDTIGMMSQRNRYDVVQIKRISRRDNLKKDKESY